MTVELSVFRSEYLAPVTVNRLIHISGQAAGDAASSGRPGKERQ